MSLENGIRPRRLTEVSNNFAPCVDVIQGRTTMRTALKICLTFLAMVSSAGAFAGDPCDCPSPCVEETCSADRWHFRIERCEQKTKVETPTVSWYDTRSKTTCERDLPCGTKEKCTVTEVIPI